MAEKKQFKAESKRLLDLMINSIYTHKEIFLRELISNASDATDKLYYKALTENISEINKSDLTIDLAFDKENRTLTVTDHGIGMNKEECRLAWGIASDINKTTLNDVEVEQWIYRSKSKLVKNKYVYFSNDTISAIQK